MVATARLAVGLSGLRNRNTRVTNKTQLHVVKGSIEADPIILDDDDDEKNRILASQGVDEEDANVSLVNIASGSWSYVAHSYWLSEYEFPSADC